MISAMLAIFLFIAGLSSSSGAGDPPAFFLVLIWGFFTVFYGVMMTPSFVAGYGLLKRKKWAKTASIVAGVFAGMSFPLGTAVCIYTFWFLFSEPGKVLYDRPAYALPPPPPRWGLETSSSRRQPQYAPPATPPDWR
jgi:hypothetical protein